MVSFKINKEYIDYIKEKYKDRDIIFPGAEYRESLKKVDEEDARSVVERAKWEID